MWSVPFGHNSTRNVWRKHAIAHQPMNTISLVMAASCYRQSSRQCLRITTCQKAKQCREKPTRTSEMCLMSI